MIKATVLSACFAALFLFWGCASVPGTATPECDDLIQSLSESPMQNRVARSALKKLGKRAVPRLLIEVDRSATYLRSPDHALTAIRALRVLREIGTPEVLPVCRRLLIKEYFPPSEKHEAAFLNEIMDALYDHFNRREARDIFFAFVSGDSSRYARRVRQPKHWEPAEYRPRVEVDVVRGIQLMVTAKDDRAGAALAAFLQSIDAQSMKRTYFHRLAENGYAVTEATTGKGIETLKRQSTPPPPS